MPSVQYTKSLPVVAEPDVLVCGTGLAGIGAAVAAARNGVSVLAVDRMGFAGGFFTNIIGSAFDGFVFEDTGKPVVGGLVFEMLERMGVVEPGQAPHLSYNVNGDFTEVEKHPDRVIPRTDPELFKKAADDVLVESGVQPLFHSQVSDVIVNGDRVETVIVSNKDLGAKSLLAFHNGRGTQEGLFAELKSQTQLEYVPTRRLVGNQVYVLSAMIAHNLNRELQMIANQRDRHTTGRRAPLWRFNQLGTLRRQLIQRAGRLTQPQGRLTLTMGANPDVESDMLHYLNALKQAA